MSVMSIFLSIYSPCHAGPTCRKTGVHMIHIEWLTIPEKVRQQMNAAKVQSKKEKRHANEAVKKKENLRRAAQRKAKVNLVFVLSYYLSSSNPISQVLARRLATDTAKLPGRVNDEPEAGPSDSIT